VLKRVKVANINDNLLLIDSLMLSLAVHKCFTILTLSLLSHSNPLELKLDSCNQ